MEKLFNELYLKDDPHSGESDFYIDENLSIPYNGVVIDKVDNIILWKFDVKNGKRSGLEYVFSREGALEQINECRENLIFGISKEFDKVGNVKLVSVVYNNVYIKLLEVENTNIRETLYEEDFSSFPQYIQDLLKLSNFQLKDYEFCSDNNIIWSTN